MLNPPVQTRTARIATAASDSQTLPFSAVAVVGAFILGDDAVAGDPVTGDALTPVADAPDAGEIQFTGTPAAPSTALTLNAAVAANLLLVVEYIPVGGI